MAPTASRFPDPPDAMSTGRFYFSLNSPSAKNRNVPAFLMVALVLAASVAAQDLVFSAKVDKTTVNIGDPINLTLTLSGDMSGVRMPAPKFPEGFAVLARSQSTNFSIRAGAVERSTGLNFVLVPQQAGTFTLGPFTLEHQKKTIQTEPIEITVNKPVLPPNLQPNGERFTL